MGLPALDENKKCIVGVLGFFSLSWAGQQNANEFSEISPGTHVTMPSFVGRRWQVTSPNFSLWHNFPCRNFRCHRPQLFSNKKWKTSLSFYLLQFLFFYFRHFVLPLYTCHLFIYMNSVNINLHKIKQNNWKINDHSSFVGRRWQVTSPNFSLWHNFPCRNFRCHRPQLFSNKKWKTSLSFYLLQFLFFYFRHFVLPLYTCHLFIYCEYKSPQNKAE